MKISTPHHSIVLPLLAAGVLAGVAEAASSGVRVHRIGDPPMLPRNLIITGPQVEAPETPAVAPRAAEARRTVAGPAGHAVPMAPVGQEVGSAPVMSVPTTAPAHRTVGQVPLAPIQGAPQPALNYNQHVILPEPEPEPELITVRESDLPLAPAKYVEAPEAVPTEAPAAQQPPMLRRSRLPLAPVGFVPAPKPVAPAAPVVTAPAPKPVVPVAPKAAPVVVTPPPAPKPVVPVAPKPAPVVTAPAPKPVVAPAPVAQPAPAAAPKPQPRRRLPIAPVVNEPTDLPPLPANLVR